MEIQLESELAVHEHWPLDARTWKLPDPPACGKLPDESDSDIEQSAPAWVTLACLSLSAMTPRRVEGSLLADATNSIDPSPCPLDAPRIDSQLVDELAADAHSRAVDTATRPLPPPAGTLMSVDPSVTLHVGKVAGAVDVVDEDPHPARIRAERSETRRPDVRCAIGGLGAIKDSDALLVRG